MQTIYKAMGKKHNKQQIVEEPEVVDEYKHVPDTTDRDFIIRILEKVKNAPRIKSKWETIINIAQKRKNELETKNEPVDQNLDALITQLQSFIDFSDPRKQITFNNYEEKFFFRPV
jgi:predicted 2-oxoglutarate/Fe(II)-dependent dioxygenase YbiX